MSPDARELEVALAAAQAGTPGALGQTLEACRTYLLHVAEAEFDPRLKAKLGASDLVQETFMEAQLLFHRFQGCTTADLLAWLRAILLNKAGTLSRQYLGTLKRQIKRETALDGGQGFDLAGDTSTPSQLLVRREEQEAVAKALARLPDHYRAVIVWRQWEGVAFEEIARRLDRGVDAARMLWWRAIERLQKEMDVSQ